MGKLLARDLYRRFWPGSNGMIAPSVGRGRFLRYRKTNEVFYDAAFAVHCSAFGDVGGSAT